MSQEESFTCLNGQTIFSFNYCDGLINCWDRSDEDCSSVIKRKYAFQCVNSSTLIHIRFVNDF